MNKQLTLLVAFFIATLSLISSCKKDSSSTPASTLKITTLSATNIAGIAVDLGANITGTGSVTYLNIGVCWSTNSNPNITVNNSMEVTPSGDGDYTFSLIDKLIPQTTYHVRAYYQDDKGITYGQDISFTTGAVVSTSAPTEIYATKATMNGFVYQASTATSDPGFVISTSPNPTVNNSGGTTYTYGSSSYKVDLVNLQYNTTYYVRAFAEINGAYYYGEEKSFKTTGYWGPAGGYVVYDKGENSNGWRYMELWHTTLSYNISWTTGSAWGDYNTFISGTGDQIGDGPANTDRIINNTSTANCAAKLCDAFTGGGYTDWYLPSSAEMLMMYNTLKECNVSYPDNAWTSTQVNASDAYSIYYNINTGKYELFNAQPKNMDNLRVFPARRY